MPDPPDFADGDLEKLSALTAREREVLRLVGQHRQSKEIARLLNISKSTVDGHIASAREKLGTVNRYEAAQALVSYEYAMGLTPPESGGVTPDFDPFGHGVAEAAALGSHQELLRSLRGVAEISTSGLQERLAGYLEGVDIEISTPQGVLERGVLNLRFAWRRLFRRAQREPIEDFSEELAQFGIYGSGAVAPPVAESVLNGLTLSVTDLFANAGEARDYLVQYSLSKFNQHPIRVIRAGRTAVILYDIERLRFGALG